MLKGRRQNSPVCLCVEEEENVVQAVKRQESSRTFAERENPSSPPPTVGGGTNFIQKKREERKGRAEDNKSTLSLPPRYDFNRSQRPDGRTEWKERGKKIERKRGPLWRCLFFVGGTGFN